VKAAEVHNLKDDELVEKLIGAKEEAFNLRFRHATGELENTARLGQAKPRCSAPGHRGPPARDRFGERDATSMSDESTRENRDD